MVAYLPYYWGTVCFCIGAVVGSFLNVVILRIPRDESIVIPGSRCPHCKNPIMFYDNIPIVSYLVLRGRCRKCKGKISIRYAVIELLTACLCLGLYLRWGLTPTFVAFFVFSAAMMAVFWIDLDHMIIPDSISLNGLPVGITASIIGILPGMDWKLSVIGMLLGGAIPYLLAVLYAKIRGIEGLGGGDVKLLAMIGTFIGPFGVAFVLFWASVVGSLVAVCGMIFKKTPSTTAIPFGPFLTASAVTYVFLGEQWIHPFLRYTAFIMSDLLAR
jgi:leader peptidase (prepilin peptidase)/N-methyltransferase